MFIITIANKKDLSYDFSFKHNMHAVECKLNAMINRNKRLINSFNQNWRYPLNRKFDSYRFQYILMDTMKDVPCIVNELVFADKLDNDYPKKLVEVKMMVFREFEVYIISKMIYASNIIEEIKLTDVTNDLDYHVERTDSLRSVIFFI